MAQVQFKQQASFSGINKVYKVGIHSVPDEVVAHPFFKHLLKSGLVVPGAGEAPKPLETIDERNLRLAAAMTEKLESQKAAAEKSDKPEVYKKVSSKK